MIFSTVAALPAAPSRRPTSPPARLTRCVATPCSLSLISSRGRRLLPKTRAVVAMGGLQGATSPPTGWVTPLLLVVDPLPLPFFARLASGGDKIKSGGASLPCATALLVQSCARSGTRTRTALRPRDFKSLVSTIPPSGLPFQGANIPQSAAIAKRGAYFVLCLSLLLS